MNIKNNITNITNIKNIKNNIKANITNIKNNITNIDKVNGKKEEIRRKRKNEIDLMLKNNHLENIKPSLCLAYIKYGIPKIESIFSLFKGEQKSKEERLYELINELKNKGYKYDERVPIYEKYIKDGGDIKSVIKEGGLEYHLVKNTKYNYYLKHNNVQTARYLSVIEFMNSGKNNEIIKKFALKNNTIKFR